MKKTRKIQDYDFLYDFLRYYVDFAFKLAYQRVEYRGKDNIPSDGAVIFAPNHTNGLQDALAILALDHGPKVFVARADIFKKPTLRKILTFLKIMPILRKRDGMENLGRNDAIMEQASQVLMDKVPFCIMAEGTHRPKHSLLPLLKGIFRIAVKADNHIDGRMPVYIVPVGVEYGNYFRFRSSLLVNVGKPFDISAFRHDHSDLSEAEMMHLMREELTRRMQNTIFYVPDDEDYDAVLTICHILCEDRLRVKGQRNTLYNRMLENQRIVGELTALKSDDPQRWSRLREQAELCSSLCRENGISAYSIARPDLNKSIIGHSLLALVGLPFWMFSVVTASPVLLVSWLVCRTLKDPSFRNSFRYVLTLILHPLVIAAWAAVFFCCIPNLWLAGGLWLLSCLSVIISHDWWKALRHLVSDVKFARCLRKSDSLAAAFESVRSFR